LIYSRSLSPQVLAEIDLPNWIESVAASVSFMLYFAVGFTDIDPQEKVVHNNEQYLAQINPEDANKVYVKLGFPLADEQQDSLPIRTPARTGALNSRSSERMDVA
jgi:hypothetical protein